MWGKQRLRLLLKEANIKAQLRKPLSLIRWVHGRQLVCSVNIFLGRMGKQAKQTSGYIVQYSTTKDFTKNTTKTVKIGNPNTVQLTVKNCKRNTVHYVRVRTYKEVGKQTYYSGWQAPSYVKSCH